MNRRQFLAAAGGALAANGQSGPLANRWLHGRKAASAIRIESSFPGKERPAKIAS